ncbi:MAG TPA: hypothetical protein VKB72_01675 [Steroidobacteraceae bacterium]|nr:hypothetical protein [Steroidobacteraceae bacterium]
MLLLPVLLSLWASEARPAAFDLAGPTLEIEVTRGTRTLPAAEVPNLAVGDRVSLKADLPAGESAHYLMVAAFLRGATNPPPTDWFFSCETWTRRCAKEGLTLSVPESAGQLLVFLAPHTGGGFKTLVDAVRGRPGAFVRTSQDLRQAALDHSRLDAYLAAVRRQGEVDPSQLKEAAPLLARSLAIKVDEACLAKIPVLQGPCLAQGRESLILDDGHSASLAQALTSGPASDLAMEASNTPQLKSGYYGPFIGSILDIARILDSLHTAQYQYFPALTTARGREVALTLNAPPSFHDPKSVLVVAMPPVEAPEFPALHPVNAGEALCASKDPLLLPVEGAPVVFSTGYLHDAVLHLVRKDGSALDLPARADPARGGFVVKQASGPSKVSADTTVATLRGEWGFDRFEGPAFKLTNAHAQAWSLSPGESADLIAGRTEPLHLRADSVSCLDDITLVDSTARPHKVEWKRSGASEVQLTLPLQEVQPGELSLQIWELGHTEVQALVLHAFSQAAHLESFNLHAGDTEGLLRGNRLDEVRTLSLSGVQFTPATRVTRDGRDELTMLAQSGSDTRELKGSSAQVTLSDGRTLAVPVSVDSPRPSAALISKTVEWPGAAAENAIRVSNNTEVPLEARLSFSLRAVSPAAFSRDEKLEVATTDGAFSVVLGVAAGDVILQSRRIAVVSLDPSRALGASAFGPLQVRRVVEGTSGEWIALGTLVRLPKVVAVDCPADPAAACAMSGSNLFLLDSISADPDFARPTRVPDGFTEGVLAIPHPAQGKIYVKLRDDPAVVDVVNVKSPGQPTDTRVAAPQSEPSNPPQARSGGDTSAAEPAAPPQPIVTAKNPPGHSQQ